MAYLWPSISVPKMRCTETVHLFDARVFGDFDRLCVGGLAKFLSVCGKHLAGLGEISVNGAAPVGIDGQNLRISRVFAFFFAPRMVRMTKVRELGAERREGKLVRSRVPKCEGPGAPDRLGGSSLRDRRGGDAVLPGGAEYNFCAVGGSK